MSADELADIAAKSNEVVSGLGVQYKWITSYVAGDKIYCVHETQDADRRSANMPCAAASRQTWSVEIAAVIGPDTAR